MPLLFFASLRTALVGAQDVHGVVRDSTSREPVSSAVIAFFDANGVAVGRNLSNERGMYRVAISQPAVRAHVVRLGYRPRDIKLADGVQELDIVLSRMPATLEEVRVHASVKCPQRRDGAAALALLEQARSGLLSTIVAREANPATMKLLDFRQILDGDKADHLTVKIDSADKAATSFVAEKSGAEFVQYGFSRHDSLGGHVLSGPDADVLLDDGFAAGYCFRIQESDRNRPRQVGLGFFPAEEKRGRVDIDGTLWIDTAARSLRDIEFRYVGMPDNQGGVDAGGHIYFREMPNGVVLIDRWSLRMATSRVNRGRITHVPMESGGEVARARWSDGQTWEASLGTLTLHLVDAVGAPVPRAIVMLDSTEYAGSADSLGTVVIPDLFPGRYTVMFVDTALAHVPISIRSAFQFVAQRGKTDEKVLHVPSEDDFLQVACRAAKDRHWVRIVVVNDIDNSPAAAAIWEIGAELGSTSERVMGHGTVRDDGTRGICVRPPDHVALQMRARGADDPQRLVIEKLGDAEAVVLKLPVKR